MITLYNKKLLKMIKRPNDLIDRFRQVPDMTVEAVFPWFGWGFHYIDSIMSVYASTEYWAIVLQVIGVNQHDPDITSILNVLFSWDNKNNTGLNLPEVVPIASDGNDGKVLNMFKLNPNVKTMKIRDTIVPIPQSKDVYEKKNIDLLKNGQVLTYHLMRALTPEYRDTFFLTDKEIRNKLDMDIPKLLQLEEWRHPIVYEDTTQENPADCEVFQLIAKVIERLDPSLYKPTEKPNTHWSNWTENDAHM